MICQNLYMEKLFSYINTSSSGSCVDMCPEKIRCNFKSLHSTSITCCKSRDCFPKVNKSSSSTERYALASISRCLINYCQHSCMLDVSRPISSSQRLTMNCKSITHLFVLNGTTETLDIGLSPSKVAQTCIWIRNYSN